MRNTSYIQYPVLLQFPELLHFCTTRHGGVSTGNYGAFNISPYSGDDNENQRQNLKLLSNTLQPAPASIIFPYQTHSDCVKTIDTVFFSLSETEKTEFLHGVDALITNLPKVCIGVTTADCVPVLIYDSKNKIVAAVHAGWRGTCSRIAEKTIQQMVASYGTKPADVYASIGVSISPAVYNVGEELINEFFENNFPVNEIFERRENTLFLDLWKANKWLLQCLGIPENQIEIAGICSYTNQNEYFSARRLGIKSGRMLSGIAISDSLY